MNLSKIATTDTNFELVNIFKPRRSTEHPQ